jgi:hypothetical protein
VLTVIDDFSGMAANKLLKHKSEATTQLRAILNVWEHDTDLRVKKLRTD